MKCLLCGLTVYNIRDSFWLGWFSMHSSDFRQNPYCKVAILRNRDTLDVIEVHISCRHRNIECVYFPLSQRSDKINIESFHSLGNFINKGFKI